jgi:DNA-binding response OmpR family regulator
VELLAAEGFMANILYVDDEPSMVAYKRLILKAAGHSVTAATSVKEAVEKLQANAYDAVITDWRLGDGDGRMVIQVAKSHSTIPVMVISGYISEAFQAAEPLADRYLEKPVAPEELVTFVNELLNTRKPQPVVTMREHTPERRLPAHTGTAVGKTPPLQQIKIVKLRAAPISEQ